MTRLSPRSFVTLLAAACVLSHLGAAALAADAPPVKAPTAAASAAADYGIATPPAIQSALEEAMQAKVKILLDEKNSEGIGYKRGSFSHRFMKVDETTYQVTMYRDTSRDDDTLLTERLLVTLKLDAMSHKWKIVSEDVQDSYSNLYRREVVAGDFPKFSSFSISREGFKVTTGPGTLFKIYRNDQVDGITLTASDITFEYTPPDKMQIPLYEKLKKDHNADVIFKPEYMNIECDPTSCQEILATAFQGLPPDKGPPARGAGSPPSGIDSKLRSLFDEGTKDEKKRRKENPFGGFRRPYTPDHKFYYIELAKDTPDKRVALSYDSWDQKEVSFWAYGLNKSFAYPSRMYRYYSEATLKSGVSPYDLERRDDAEGRDCNLTGLNGTVELGLEDPETLHADVTFKMTTKREIRELPFRISRLAQGQEERRESRDPQMIINSIEDGNGNPLTFVKLFSAGGLVILPKSVPDGTPLTIHIDYTNKAGVYNFTSTFSYVDRQGWLPFVRFTDMINDFKLTTKVPARKTALGIGRKVSERVDGDVKITEWTSDSPVEFPSITFGEYMEAESKVEAKKSDGTKIPVKIHVDKGGIPIFEGIRMRDIMQVTPGGIQFLADQAANALNLYREIYGVDYPYAKLDLVNDPVGLTFYGQSPSSLIYLGEGTFASQGVAGEMGGSQLSKFNRTVVPHEVGHQWWGSLIPNHNDGNYWFVESLAEYSSALFVEFESGKDDKAAYQDKVMDWRRVILDTDLQAPVQEASMSWQGSQEGRGYQAAVYNKGPYAFHVMRMTWGDEKFFKFLKNLAQKLKNKDIVTRDIQKVAEETFGGNMDFFFDQWLRGVGNPEYTFNYSVRETEDQKYMLEGTVDQRVLIGTKKDVLEGQYFTAVVPITVIGKSGKEYRIPLRIQGAKTQFQQKLPEAPKEVTLNKFGESLAYDVIVNKTASK